MHEATGRGPVSTVLQICVAEATQLATPAAAVQLQVVAVQGGVVPALAVKGVQPSGAGVGPEVAVVQAVAIQLLPEDATAFVQEPVGVGPFTSVLQLVVVQEFSAVAAIGVQAVTPVGPVSTVLQVMSTYELIAAAVCGVHEATPPGPEVTVLQLVLV